VILLQFFLIFIQLVYASNEATDKVAVIVESGDIGGLQSQMDDTTALGQKIYSESGYRVIVLSTRDPQHRPTGEQLIKTLAELHNIKDLRLDFIGHGGLATVPNILQKRFPPIQFTDGQKQSGYSLYPIDLWSNKNVAWFAPNSGDSDDFLALNDPLDHSAAKQRLIRNSIGVGDILAAIGAFQKDNPDSLTTGHALNCFSGAVGEQLSQLPNVQFFSATGSQQVNIAIDPSMAKAMMRNSDPDLQNAVAESVKNLSENNNMILYYSRLADDLKNRKSETFWQINMANLKSYKSEMGGVIDTATGPRPPRSSLVQYVMNWCVPNEHVAMASSNTKTPRQTEIMRLISSEIDPYIEDPSVCKTSCELKQVSDEARRQYIEVYNRLLPKAMDEIIAHFDKLSTDDKIQISVNQALQRAMRVKLLTLSVDPTNKQISAEIPKFIQKETQIAYQSPAKYIQLFRQGILRYRTEIINDCSGQKSVTLACEANGVLTLKEIIFQDDSSSTTSESKLPGGWQKDIAALERKSSYSAFKRLSEYSSAFSSDPCPSCHQRVAIFQSEKDCLTKFEDNADNRAWQRLDELYSYGNRPAIEFATNAPNKNISTPGQAK
jgi:hypothetical protein